MKQQTTSLPETVEDQAWKQQEKGRFTAGDLLCRRVLLGGWKRIFPVIPGVESVTAGYANGTTDAPTYEQVCTGTTGHAETRPLWCMIRKR